MAVDNGVRRQHARNWTTWLALVTIAAYAIFVQWLWGWGTIAAAWREVGLSSALLALALLMSTYVVRAHRMHDYFPHQTRGRFLRLLRVTQVHNLLNIMLPFRAGETSFPLLMRAEFEIPLARGTSALLVLRLLDLHALLAAGGTGLVMRAGFHPLAVAAWLLFLMMPIAVWPLRALLAGIARRRLPQRLAGLVDEVDAGIPANLPAFLRAWMLTVINWAVKVLVIAWVLALMGVLPWSACFGGALGGELSSVLPLHAPGGVGTYPAGIAAGAAALGSAGDRATLAVLARASINVHLLIVVSALAGTALSLIAPSRARPG